MAASRASDLRCVSVGREGSEAPMPMATISLRVTMFCSMSSTTAPPLTSFEPEQPAAETASIAAAVQAHALSVLIAASIRSSDRNPPSLYPTTS